VPLVPTTVMTPPREPGAASTVEVVIPSDPAEARRVQDEIERLLRAHEATEKDIFGIRLALEEALVNAIKHGNQLDRSKTVTVASAVQGERFEVHITDEGSGFDPGDVPDPTAVENIERPCGRGLLLIRGFMTEVTYHGCGNSVSMCKIRDGA